MEHCIYVTAYTVHIIINDSIASSLISCNDNEKYMGSNPAATRNEKNAHWVDPCTEGAPIVRQDLSGRPAM